MLQIFVPDSVLQIMVVVAHFKIASKLTIRRDLCKRTTGGASVVETVPAPVLTASSIKRSRRRGASAMFSTFV